MSLFVRKHSKNGGNIDKISGTELCRKRGRKTVRVCLFIDSHAAHRTGEIS